MLYKKTERVERPIGTSIYWAFAVTCLAGSACFAFPEFTLQSPGPQPSATVESVAITDLYGNPCDGMMSSMKGMTVMGESMDGMTNHMCITPTRPELPSELKDRSRAWLSSKVRFGGTSSTSLDGRSGNSNQ